jgi:hypothetical protein
MERKKSHQKVAQEVINGNYKRVSLTFIYKNENELSVRAKCPTPSFRGLKKLNTSEHVLNVELLKNFLANVQVHL